MSYNIIHDDGRNPMVWNNVLANGVRSNSLYSLTIDTPLLVANSLQANSISTPILNATSIIANDIQSSSINCTSYNGVGVDVTDISCDTITASETKTGEILLPPYNQENILKRYYSYTYTDMTLTSMDASSDKANVFYELIGRSCNILITPVSSAPFINNRLYLAPQAFDSINIPFTELGNDVANMLFDTLDEKIVIQGTGYYLDSANQQTRSLYNWTLQKGSTPAFSILQLTKQNWSEFLGSPSWLTTQVIFSICISFCTIN